MFSYEDDLRSVIIIEASILKYAFRFDPLRVCVCVCMYVRVKKVKQPFSYRLFTRLYTLPLLTAEGRC